MATVSIKRQLEIINETFSADLSTGALKEISNIYYLPLTFDNFAPDDLTITGVTGVLSETKLTSSVSGTFDNVRVGDVIVSLGSGAVAALNTFTRTVYTVNGLPILVYASSFNSSNLGVKAGDAVSGTGIAVGSKVDKIDYGKRLIYLTANCSASAEVTATFAPPVRVTAVRKSTATVNPNQIDIDSTVSTASTGDTLTLKIGYSEAIYGVLKIEPIGSTTGGKITVSVSTHLVDPLTLQGASDGVTNLNLASLNYSALGTFALDADSFLLRARLPRSNGN